jgi:hypothetical protein
LICDFRHERELQNVNSADCETLFVRVLRFFQLSLDPSFVAGLENESFAFQAAHLIHENRPHIKRVRVVVLTSGRLSVRKALATTRTEGGVRFTCTVLDFQRYLGIQNSTRGVDPVEIDLTESPLAPLPCLAASSDNAEYSAYLVVVPASILAEVYGLYGARLLESNVRSFLQAKTKVNKGIQTTLKSEPRNFFAYNNGITATASDIRIETINGIAHITSIRDLQIVNGGQTTASILYARDKERSALADVYVQMKLSVVAGDAVDDLVPKISRYANSQNKISDADFFSSHPFHLQMERMSRRIAAPVRDGETVATKWFYERARGQYKDGSAYLPSAQKKKFEMEHPKDQMLVKTDLAKYELSFEMKPDSVSLGSQKCFLEFAKFIEDRWDPEGTAFGDGYFRDAMARALIFRWTDKMIGGAGWYQNDRAYKSQTVAYTLSLLVRLLARRGLNLDFRKIWTRQEMPDGLRTAIGWLAPRVATFIRTTPATTRNVSEYCKRPACWKAMCAAFDESEEFPVPEDSIVDIADARQSARDDRSVRKIDIGIDAQTQVFKLGPKVWAKLKEFAIKRRIGGPAEQGALEICAAIPGKIPTERQCAAALRILESAKSEGFSH